MKRKNKNEIQLKSREQRARRILEKQGYRLSKNRMTDGVNAGLYMIIDIETNIVFADDNTGGWRTIEEVETFAEQL